MEPHQHDAQPSPEPGPSRPIEVTVRRSPKFWPFLVAGAFVGVFAAIISAYTGQESAEFTRGTVLGFLAVFFGMGGLALGAIAWLVTDRVQRKRARRATAVPLDGPDAAR
ncbi:hypothetical protein NCCP1664_09170 [Zafaria cholistanensis]|uniref:Uncharacterized protein n=1 Tax=Zafaria cholistanensis TaxID=1682741 RepID=A0A5A7NNQ0_9MICC|nr:hypothetical protein [Zafaria cholistanensis]GER22420.1 hypothetical protein NCCP1664_09170 [Zafaria cholistanensis]